MRAIRGSIPSSLRTLAGRFGLTLVIVLSGFLSGLAYGLVKPPTYSATAFVLIVSQREPGSAAVNFAQAYARLAPLTETLAWSANGLPPEMRERAQRSLQASSSPDTPLVRLTGTASTPARAAEYANIAADALYRYGIAHQRDTGVRVALMTEAAPPLVPSSPNLPLNIAVGTATGILLGGLAAVSGIAGRIRPFRKQAPLRPGTAQAPLTRQRVPVETYK